LFISDELFKKSGSFSKSADCKNSIPEFLYKAIIYFAKGEAAGIIVGAGAPFVLTSRSDSEVTKLNSILLAVAYDDK